MSMCDVSHRTVGVLPRLLVLACAVLMLAGCGSSSSSDPRLQPVTGTVTVAGKPVTKGIVRFTSTTESNSSSGQLDASGRFELMSGPASPGALPGEYQVAIEAWQSEPTFDAKGNVIPGERAVPEKYFHPAQSGLTAVVKPDGKNDFTFNLE